MKKALITLFSLCIILFAFSISASAMVIYSGTCGDNLTWTLDDNGTLTISGTGEMDDYSYTFRQPWYSIKSQVKKVIIEDGLTSIGYSAFSSCESLTSIEIPNSVTSIGDEAFDSCTSLSNVEIPGSVTVIGYYAFNYCTSLASITIPDGVTIIGMGAFKDCTSLVSVEMPCSITVMPLDVFDNCISLSSVEIPNSVTVIEEFAFNRCINLKDVYYGGTKEEWEKIYIEESQNEYLLNAKIHYNHVNMEEKTSNSTSLNAPIIKSVRLGYKGKFYDVVNQTVNIEKGSSGIGNIYVDVAWNGTAPSNHKVYLTQGANTNGENNTFVSFDQLTQTFKNISLGTTFEAGKPIYIVAIDTTGPQASSSSLVTKINIVDLSDNEVFENAKYDHKFSLGKDISFTIPEDVPLFGGTELSWKLDFIPLTIKSEDGKIDIVFGMDLEDDAEFSFDSFKKDIDDYVDVLNKKSNKQNRTLKQLRNDLRMSEANKRKNKGLTMSMWGGKVLKNSSSGETDTGVDVLGYARAALDKDGNVKLTEGYLCFEVEVEYTYNGQVFIWVIPCYYTFGGSVGGKMDATIKDLDFKDFSPKIQTEISATVGAKIGGGIGVPKVACFGATGNGNVTLTFNINNFEEAKNYQKVTIGANAEFNLTVLGQDVVSKDIWKLDEEDGIIYSTFPEDADKSWIKANSASLMSIEDMYNGYSANNIYQTESRAYLLTPMKWLADEPKGSLFAADYTNRELTQLASGIYTEAQPQIFSIDGTKVLVFTIDNEDRTAMNKQMLVYSVYDDENCTWSEPLPVKDDGTADFYPSVCGKYIVWQNQKIVLEDGLTLAEIGKQGEIVVAKWNGNGFDEPVVLTDNDELDTLPKIAINDDEISVVWLKNSANDILGVDGVNSITKRMFDGSNWTSETEIKSGLNMVTDLSVGYYGDILNVAYVHDTDGDLATINDREVCLINEEEISITNNEVCDTNPVINNGKIYWYSESNIYFINLSDNSVNTIFEDAKYALESGFTVSENGENIVILWSGVEGEGSEIKGVLLQDGKWGDIITVSQLGAKAKYPTCVLENDGTILTSFTAESNDVTSLYTLGLFPSYDIAITDVYFNEKNLALNAENEFEIILTNNGELPVEGYTVSVYNADESLNNSIAFEDTVKPGETKVIIAKFITGDSISYETLNVKVIMNENEEYVYDNNSIGLNIGHGDALLESIAVYEQSPYSYAVANINNSGYTDINNITVNLRFESVDGEIVQSKTISSLAVGASEEITFAYVPAEYENVKWYITVETEDEEISVGNNNDYFINEYFIDEVEFEHTVLNYSYTDNILTINTFTKNNAGNGVNGTAYAAVYNKTGKMKGVTLQSFGIAKYSDTGIDMWISNYEYEEGDYIKVFAWDTSFVPMCEMSTVNI